MANSSLNNGFFDKAIQQLSNYSPFRIIVIGTLFVLTGSIPLVYVFALMFNVEYTLFLTIISIVLPILLSPLTLFLFIKMTRYLNYFKKHLEMEIAENKKKDIIIYEQARFALMGEMMANISHQWKQPLNAIGLSIANTRLDKDKNIDECFDVIEDNIKYLSSTINDFISFFDTRTPIEVRNIDDTIQEINSIMSATLSDENIDMLVDVDKDCKNISLSSFVSQILLNLVNNSKDAFYKDKIDKKILLKFICSANNLTILCFDNGKGIEPEIAEKIFSPYFTTKMKTQGTGIGLYMSKQIANQFFDGDLRLLNKKEFMKGYQNMNTCFQLTIPFSKNCNRGS